MIDKLSDVPFLQLPVSSLQDSSFGYLRLNRRTQGLLELDGVESSSPLPASEPVKHGTADLALLVGVSTATALSRRKLLDLEGVAGERRRCCRFASVCAFFSLMSLKQDFFLGDEKRFRIESDLENEPWRVSPVEIILAVPLVSVKQEVVVDDENRLRIETDFPVPGPKPLKLESVRIFRSLALT